MDQNINRLRRNGRWVQLDNLRKIKNLPPEPIAAAYEDNEVAHLDITGKVIPPKEIVQKKETRFVRVLRPRINQDSTTDRIWIHR